MDDKQLLEYKYSLTITSLADMENLGRRLGALMMPGDVLLLYGGLGAGKTTLTQAIGRGLEVPAEYYISSPSFALMHEYPGRLPLFHIDCYRLSGEDDVEGAGLVEYLETKTGICVVEWPQRLGTLTPAGGLRLDIHIGEEKQRRLEFTTTSPLWAERWSKLTGD